MSTPPQEIQVNFRISRKQKEFLKNPALFKAFCAGRGAGKSWIGAYDMLLRTKPGRHYMVGAPTYGMLRDATLKSFLQAAEALHLFQNLNKSTLDATLTNGAAVAFRSADDPERWRGPNLSGIWLDEASVMVEDAYKIGIACLREEGEQGWLSGTFTPKGKQHWTYKVFGVGELNTALINARTTDNPFLPPEFYRTIRGQYNSTFAAQELEGQFIDAQGTLFRRDWFRVVEAAPVKMVRKVRYWDLAATQPRKGHDPDWTAGVLMGLAEDNRIYILDVRRVQASPLAVENLVKQTAMLDGVDTVIWMEREPGASGVSLMYHYLTLLVGFTFYPDIVSGDKLTRAQPFAAQAEPGNVLMVKGSWNNDFLEELSIFPMGVKDDQVDAASSCFSKLTLGWVPSGIDRPLMMYPEGRKPPDPDAEGVVYESEDGSYQEIKVRGHVVEFDDNATDWFTRGPGA
jgi:predicted phage terminase large subunit-like protein